MLKSLTFALTILALSNAAFAADIFPTAAQAAWLGKLGFPTNSIPEADYSKVSFEDCFLLNINPTNAVKSVELIVDSVEPEDDDIIVSVFLIRVGGTGAINGKLHLQGSQKIGGPFTNLENDVAVENANFASGNEAVFSFSKKSTAVRPYYRVIID